MKKRKIFITIGAVIALLFMICIYFTFLYTYHGKVIDAETKEPIEGAVVVVTWSTERATATGPSGSLKDVKETLTDKNGEWSIRGPRGMKGGNIMAIFTFLTGLSYTRPPEIIIFKPGYCSWPGGFSIESCRKKMQTSGVKKGESIELPKLEVRDRETLLRNIPYTFADSDKMPIFKKLLDQDIEGPKR
jgi:hypothetical protein